MYLIEREFNTMPLPKELGREAQQAMRMAFYGGVIRTLLLLKQGRDPDELLVECDEFAETVRGFVP